MGETGEQWKTKQIVHMSIACSDWIEGCFLFFFGGVGEANTANMKKHEII